MTGRLDGKTAFITGAASGIGRAAALRFAREGAKVVLLDIAKSAGEAVAAEITREGGAAVYARCDITSPESVTDAVAAGRARFDGADVLLNCAGGSSGGDGSLVTADLDELWRVMRLDLFGTILACRAILPAMIAAGGGAIVNMSSVVSLIGVPGLDFYTAAKGGVSALTRALAQEHAQAGVRVNAIAPGITLTERVMALSGGDVTAFPLNRKQVLGPSQPDEIAAAALFLASDEAAHITGVVLPVDGGAASW